ncbi:MAG: hypothetical protein AB9891_03585 [Anaerolineaceae bacterium]
MSGLGHLAPALVLKSAAPEVPLWTLVAASELNEILYFAFTSTGIEKAAEVTYDLHNGATYLTQSVNPWSHGLVMSLVWSATATLAARLFFHGWKPAAAVGLAALSHWLLDFLMHSNLPLFLKGSPLLGLGLENSGPGFIFMTGLDLVLLAGSLILYFKRRGRKAAVTQPT